MFVIQLVSRVSARGSVGPERPLGAVFRFILAVFLPDFFTGGVSFMQWSCALRLDLASATRSWTHLPVGGTPSFWMWHALVVSFLFRALAARYFNLYKND